LRLRAKADHGGLAGRRHAPARWLWLTIGLFILLGLCVIATRLAQGIHSLEATGDRASIETACAGTPLAPVVAGIADLGEPRPLTRLPGLPQLIGARSAKKVVVSRNKEC